MAQNAEGGPLQVSDASRPEAPAGSSPFMSWGERSTASLFPKTSLQSLGGEEILFCRVRYEPGAVVASHSHEATEQVMWVLDGEIEMEVGGESRTVRADDCVVINRGVTHSLASPGGATFLEALSPVPRDHIADPERDLVLGPDGGAHHVER
jgi:mannose-6-phosphate isomerase-like protein (cupin superfamily)